ncbi:hypothetical protein AVEN_153206-1 [Araneus ventricosus]|uniref:Reverse transcriptase domain-containing protein n=1 Tax=Araneus ventricosus TaxID=182803 RepID=A0A4Y2C486_ARAVE|nr:hypothetical protein AVEN_23546-1 [Araneus ventricosus]GBL98557.1 hypothetical protein AVEN_153206-1 [Araneus ventricosus]
MEQYQHLCRISGKICSINKNIRRLLYKTVIQRTLCHGAAAWGYNMTEKAGLHSTSVSSLYYWCIQDNTDRCSPSGHRSSTPPPTNPTRRNLSWHFQTPKVPLKLQWLKNILTNNLSRTRLRHLMRFICDKNNLIVEDNH